MKTTYANRGAFLENVIQRSNVTYKRKGIAMIDKVATPVNMNIKGRKPFYEKKSTVDYIGILNNGPFVAFDAKQTKTKNLPLANTAPHQEEYLKMTARMGHIAFLLIYFTQFQTCYRLTIDDYMKFKSEHDRKSIPFDWFETNATEIKSGNGLPLDYLKNINEV